MSGDQGIPHMYCSGNEGVRLREADLHCRRQSLGCSLVSNYRDISRAADQKGVRYKARWRTDEHLRALETGM